MSRRQKSEPCTRPIAEQCADRTGAVRRADHPELCRIELLSDAQLDALRFRFPSRAEDGMDEYDALSAELARRDAELAPRLAELSGRLPYRPVASVVVCARCGERGYVTAERRWDVDRAMARLEIGEREVLGLLALLEEPAALPAEERAWVLDRCPDGVDLDAFSIDELRRLLSFAAAS